MEDKKDFIGIIQENGGLIYKVARVYTHTREDQEDLYQDIVYQLWNCFGSFRSEAKISTWMYRIALNTAIAHRNKEKKKGNQIEIDELLLNKPDMTDGLKEERSAVLFARIRLLNDVEKGIVLLYLEGKTYEEIAGITGFSTTNIGTRLGRIKQKIKDQIA
jgi:RNA polymerase sigma factor (sigma-70 family)